MRDTINKTARFIVNYCLNHKIGNVVFGWGQGVKDKITLGKRNNQNFVQIPTSKLKERIRQLCEEVGIQFTETEESYTSKTSFLDDDFLPKLGEKPVRAASPKEISWKPSGETALREGFPPQATACLAKRGTALTRSVTEGLTRRVSALNVECIRPRTI